HKLRPRAAYSMGLIHRWSRLATRLPGFANALMRGPGISEAVKWAAGISPARRIPAYAEQSFTASYQTNGRAHGNGGRVLLWPATFNNFFRPQTSHAATRILEWLGYEIVLPKRILCCGRPLYDWGWLDKAKDLWRQTLDCLDEEIAAGTPVV